MDPKVLLETLDAALLHALKGHDADKAYRFTLARGRLVESFDMQTRTDAFVQLRDDLMRAQVVNPMRPQPAPATLQTDVKQLKDHLAAMGQGGEPGCC